MHGNNEVKYAILDHNQRVAAFQTRLVRSEPITGDPNPIQILARYGPETLAIRKPTHGTIQGSLLVRAMKTRRRFGSKTASFHVSIGSYVILLFTVVNMYLCFTFIISCNYLIYFISMTICITSGDVTDCSPYLCS